MKKRFRKIFAALTLRGAGHQTTKRVSKEALFVVVALGLGLASGSVFSQTPPPESVGVGVSAYIPISSVPIIIYNVDEDDITEDSIEITWRTDMIAQCKFSYGTDTDYDEGSDKESGYSLGHKVTLSGLDAGEEYFYKIHCFNGSQVGDKDGMSFETEEEEEEEEEPVTPPAPPISPTEPEEPVDDQSEAEIENLDGDDEDHWYEFLPDDDEEEEDSDYGESSDPEEEEDPEGMWGSLQQGIKEFAQDPRTKIASTGLAAVTGAAVGAQLASSVSSLFQLRGALFNVFSLFFVKRRKRKGIVYDSQTGQPISLAMVSVVGDDGKVKEAKTTDKHGFYFFLVPNGRYTLSVFRKGYSVLGEDELKNATVLYDPNYHQGKELEFQQEDILDVAIPLRREQEISTLEKVFSQRSFFSVSNLIFYSGFILSVVIFAFTPNWFNFLIILCYIFFYLLSRTNFAKQAWGKVTEGRTPKPFAMVGLYSKQDGSLKGRAVTDQSGRYAFIFDRGEYSLKVQSAQEAGSVAGQGETDVRIKKPQVGGKNLKL